MTQAEIKFCEYKLQRTGGFYTSLFQTIFKADDNNRAKLAMGFPDIVEVCNRYGGESGYWELLVDKYNEMMGQEILFY